MRYTVNPDYHRQKSIGETFAEVKRSVDQLRVAMRLAGVDLDDLACVMRKLKDTPKPKES